MTVVTDKWGVPLKVVPNKDGLQVCLAVVSSFSR